MVATCCANSMNSQAGQNIASWASSIAIGIVLILFPFFAQAAGVPSIISYQGRLTDSSGNLLGSSSGTTYYFKFSIWDSPTVGTGTQLWPTTAHSVPETVRQGLFNV